MVLEQLNLKKIQTRDKIDLWAKVLASKSDDLVPSPEATWWKERTGDKIPETKCVRQLS